MKCRWLIISTVSYIKSVVYWNNTWVLVVQLLKSCLTLCNPMGCSIPGFPVLHHLPELAQIHVHQVSGTIQPSRPLSSPFPHALNFSQHQVAKVLELQLQHLGLLLFPKFQAALDSNSLSGSGLVAQSCPTLETPWTLARQAPLSMGFPRQEYWSGLPFPSAGNLSDPGIEPMWKSVSRIAGRSLPLCHLGRLKFPWLFK